MKTKRKAARKPTKSEAQAIAAQKCLSALRAFWRRSDVGMADMEAVIFFAAVGVVPATTLRVGRLANGQPV